MPPKGEKLIGAGGRLAPQDATADFGRETMDAAVEIAVKEALHRLNHSELYRGHGLSLDEGRWRKGN